MTIETPAVRPANACFSSGPCAKRPGWTPEALKDAPLGRSHRAKLGKAKLKLAIDLTREVLGVPADYRIGITPGSDTGAVEMALWTLLGARGVDVLAWESFGEGWVTDIVKQLKLKDARTLKARLRRAARPHAGQFRQRRRLHLERHDLGRARAERRLDSGRPQGPDDLRRDLGRLRAGPRLAEARRRHLLLAEGAGRRSGAWRDHPLARARPSGSRATRRPGRCRNSSASPRAASSPKASSRARRSTRPRCSASRTISTP